MEDMDIFLQGFSYTLKSSSCGTQKGKLWKFREIFCTPHIAVIGPKIVETCTIFGAGTNEELEPIVVEPWQIYSPRVIELILAEV